MPKDLTLDDCNAQGVKFAGREMDNGELRFSVNAGDGSAYIRTVMLPGQEPAWQNSHYHGGEILKPGQPELQKGVVELILVQSGWVVAADLLPDGTPMLNLFEVGEYWISQPGVPHNIFQAGVTHCLKYGEPVGNPEKNGADWYPAPEGFDAWTRSLTQEEIFKQLRLSEDKIAKLTGMLKAA